MVNVNGEAGRRSALPDKGNADKVRKVIGEICGLAGASVAIEEQLDGGGDQPARRQCLQVTYTGERPMPFGQWFKLVDSIDAALDPTGLIDWELSELSEENEQERTAAWAIVPAAAD
ncbi:MAG: hypothetical protein ABSB42_18305 [Tepidisphaeraceae bacterium]|jgi:hypothetical protein